MNGKLQGKVALVTGGARGIGRAIALAFAREGAQVAINYHGSEDWAQKTLQEAKTMAGKAVLCQADVSKAGEVEAMFQKILNQFARLDVLVNNAGMYSSEKIGDLSEERWDEVFGLNIKAIYLTSRQAAKIMLEQKSGVIINFASGGGLGPDPGYRPSVAYTASKAGVVMLTKTLARELGPYVRVNAVAPGTIDSKEAKPFSEAFKERFIERNPLGRVGTTADIAKVAIFLASDDSAYITGQTLSVDGGIIMLP